MRAFRHFAAGSLEEAERLVLEQPGRVVLIAGGTDLLGTMKDDIHQDFPAAVVDLKAIPGLDYIRSEPEGLRIGALTPLAAVAADPSIRSRLGILAQAAEAVASPQIRRMGTVGGNLCQEPRCWYYRYPGNGFFCLRKGGKRCDALLGQNALHSVFGAVKVGPRPCESFCPNGNSIPEYLEKLRSGDIAAAGEILHSSNPLAAITGRVCPHFCSNHCNRLESDGAVNIPDLERYVGDYILENGARYFRPPLKENGLQVAVVGSGPAGLSAAFFLRRDGFAVTVFERNEHPGGILYYGIPRFRLPRAVVEGLVINLHRMGIDFRLNTELGRNLFLPQLRSDHDALFLAPGAWGSRALGIPGEELAVPGLRFLRSMAVQESRLDGKRVAVLGGGNVAIDCARTALRSGAEVHLLYRRSRSEMPAYAEEVQEAANEGVLLRFLAQPTRLTADGRLRLELAGMDLGPLDHTGRRSVHPRPGSESTEEFDLVLAAVGQKLEADLVAHAGLRLNAGGYFEAEQDSFQTAQEGIYAGGDAAVAGPLTIVEALYAGRKAAEAIIGDLTAEGERRQKDTVRTEALLGWSPKALSSSAPAAHLSTEPRRYAVALDAAASAAEAERCLNCGCVAVNSSDLAPVLVALAASIHTTRRTVAAADFFAARKMASTVLEAGEIVREIRIPWPESADGWQAFGAYRKYRLRKAIDFPRASVALHLQLRGQEIRKVRIVFGGVAPMPVRAIRAEASLEGKMLSPELIAEACALAVANTQALRNTGYKTAILRAYLGRILEELR